MDEREGELTDSGSRVKPAGDDRWTQIESQCYLCVQQPFKIKFIHTQEEAGRNGGANTKTTWEVQLGTEQRERR